MEKMHYVLTGFDNWKKALEKCKQHSMSDLHKQALLNIEFMQQEDIQSLITHQATILHKSLQQMQLSSLKYLLRHEMAVRGNEEVEGNLLQLLKLRSNDCSELNTWIRERKYFFPRILNEQISLMGHSVLRELLSDIKRAHWFSLIADEAILMLVTKSS